VSVYVDDMRAPFGRMIMCHMMADSREELDAMADAIGVARKWIQKPGTVGEHYDIALSMRAKAVRLGANEITLREMAAMQIRRRR
jgi:hypothetical protein